MTGKPIGMSGRAFPGRLPGHSPERRTGTAARDSRDAAASCPETDRLLHLLDAHRALTASRSQSEVLDRILDSACAALGAPSGMIAVARQDGVLDYVVHHGLHEAAVAELDALSSEPDGLTTFVQRRSGTHAALVHVAVEAHDEVCGEMYVWVDPASQRSVDEHMLAAFAGTAGAAIANHRLLEDSLRSRDWLNAAGEITRALLAGADVDTLLDVVSRALHVADADFAMLVLPDANGVLRGTVTVGMNADNYQDYVLGPEARTITESVESGRSVLVPDLSAKYDETEHPGVGNMGAAMVLPLADARGVRGAMALVRAIGRPSFTNRDLDLATTFADHVALALEMDEARNDAEFGHVLEMRNRIAEGLHDNVMQRLFATGVGLQGLDTSALPAAHAERLATYINDLDETIDEIREQVFGLRDADERKRTPGRFPHVTPEPPAPATS